MKYILIALLVYYIATFFLVAIIFGSVGFILRPFSLTAYLNTRD